MRRRNGGPPLFLSGLSGLGPPLQNGLYDGLPLCMPGACFLLCFLKSGGTEDAIPYAYLPV